MNKSTFDPVRRDVDSPGTSSGVRQPQQRGYEGERPRDDDRPREDVESPTGEGEGEPVNRGFGEDVGGRSDVERGSVEPWPAVAAGLRSAAADVRSVPIAERSDGRVTPTSTSQAGVGVVRAIARDDRIVVPPRADAEVDAYNPSSWTDTEKSRIAAIDKLNDCLRGELSAVEAYDLALRSVHDAEIASALRQLRDGHDRRVTMLRDRLRSFGVEPAQTSGAWGAFARLVQRGADLLGDRTALSALEEGESHGVRLYQHDLDACDAETRDFIRRQLLPMQRESHDLCRTLFRYAQAS